MSELWAIVASAGDLDAGDRAALAREIDEWLAAGGAGVALVTCHRVELYGVGEMPALAAARVLRDHRAAVHLLRVASGLESVIVGEDEVLHQVREALSRALRTQKVDGRLTRLFETAIATGRRARSGRTATSGDLAQGAVAWLRGRADVSGRMVVVAGAGRMGAALARSVTAAGADVIVASRQVENAVRLARVYSGAGVDLDAGAELAHKAAGVAVALGGPWTALASIARGELPPIADISAPQAVPDGVRRRLNGSFLGIDDLYRRSHPLPTAYIEDAKRLIAFKAAEYSAWLEGRR